MGVSGFLRARGSDFSQVGETSGSFAGPIFEQEPRAYHSLALRPGFLALDGFESVGAILRIAVLLMSFATHKGQGATAINYLGNVGGPIAGAAALGAGLGALIGHTDKYIFGFVVTSADSDGGSPDDTLNVRVDQILGERATSFVGRIGDREHRFDKAKTTYFFKRSATGVTITVRGTRGVFRRMGVFIPR